MIGCRAGHDRQESAGIRPRRPRPRWAGRRYQRTALERWLFYIDKYNARPKAPHLLFHMATGSGKTVLMAALILDLYRRGYRNFLFFVNSAQIIEKTKDNFLNPASAKHLFTPSVRIDDKLVDVRAVDTFDAVNTDAINIHFTTIQGLHRRMTEPKENAVTIEDFRDYIANRQRDSDQMNSRLDSIQSDIKLLLQRAGS